MRFPPAERFAKSTCQDVPLSRIVYPFFAMIVSVFELMSLSV